MRTENEEVAKQAARDHGDAPITPNFSALTMRIRGIHLDYSPMKTRTHRELHWQPNHPGNGSRGRRAPRSRQGSRCLPDRRPAADLWPPTASPLSTTSWALASRKRQGADAAFHLLVRFSAQPHSQSLSHRASRGLSGPASSISRPTRSRSMLVQRANMIEIECVARGYLAGSAGRSTANRARCAASSCPPVCWKATSCPNPSSHPPQGADRPMTRTCRSPRVCSLVGADLAERAARSHAGPLHARRELRRD